MSETVSGGEVALDDDRGPVLLARMRAAVAGQADVPLWTLSTHERAQMLTDFAGLRAQLAAWELAMIAQVESEGGVQTDRLGPRQLRQLGRQVLERVAPQVADEQLRRTLEAEERRAAQKCRLSMWDDGHGMIGGKFQIPTVRAAAFKKYLLAGAAPKHRCATGNPIPAEPPVTAQRMGEAFCELIDRYPVDRLPEAGGVTAQLVVTMDLAQLTGRGSDADRPVLTDMDEHVSAAQARMWACEAGIIPQVLGGKSVVLDQGRSQRFHTTAQRRAIATRDKTCTVHGCDAPPALCNVHHGVPWASGGRADVTTGRLLCPHHHRTIHDPRAQVRKIGQGRITITRT